jgi:PAS domain S-box-containing protein
MTMSADDKVTILLVDDQPGKLLSYEVVLNDLNEKLVKASSANEALQLLLKNEVAVILIDVCMPDLDGFELAALIREHPRFRKTAIIFISAVLLNEGDHLRGYELGAVDYVPVPVIPELLRAKVRVFVELYRKTRELENLNKELERRVADRTAELEAMTASLLESERRRDLALAAGRMGSWDWDAARGTCVWDEGQTQIFGVGSKAAEGTLEFVSQLVHPEDWRRLCEEFDEARAEGSFQTDFRIVRPDGSLRWCFAAGSVSVTTDGDVRRVSGVTVDITERKSAEERQLLLAREVDHRAKNALTIVQAIVRLTRASSVKNYIAAIEGRISALAQAHTLLSEARWEGASIAKLIAEEIEPYRSTQPGKVLLAGENIVLSPDKAQALALALHELATNAAKYGALSNAPGRVSISWRLDGSSLMLSWEETEGPPLVPPAKLGFGTKIIRDSIRHQVGGEVELDWRPTGLSCRVRIPDVVVAHEGAATGPFKQSRAAAG